MKIKLSLIFLILIIVLSSCSLPKISINISYPEDVDTSNTSEPVETPHIVFFPEETVCNHSYSKGICIFCKSIDSTYPYFSYDNISELVQKNGKQSSNTPYIYHVSIPDDPDDSYSYEIFFDTSKDQFILFGSFDMDNNLFFNLYIYLDRFGSCNFVAGLEMDDDTICAGYGDVNIQTYSFSTPIVIDRYDGMKDMELAFTELCIPMFHLVVSNFGNYISSNSDSSLSDFGFINFYS